MATETEMLDAPPPISKQLKEEILKDPNVALIAKDLGISVDEFANQIGYYINNPGAQPMLAVMSDDDLRKVVGIEPPTMEQIKATLDQVVEAAKAGQSPSAFSDAKKQKVAMPSDGGETVKAKADPKLADAIKKGRMPSKG